MGNGQGRETASSNGRGRKNASSNGEKQRRSRKRRSGWLRLRRPEAALKLLLHRVAGCRTAI